MAQVKPIIHGRDHLPGGADPIPVVATDFQSAEEHLGASGTVPALDSLQLSFVNIAGSVVDLGVTHTSIHASIPTKGVYIASAAVQVDAPALEDPEDGIDLLLVAVQSSLGWGIGGVYPPPGRGTFVNSEIGTGQSDSWSSGACVGALMEVNDWFQVTVFNRNEYDIDVNLGMSVVRVLGLP